jgi:hypothetical protein
MARVHWCPQWRRAGGRRRKNEEAGKEKRRVGEKEGRSERDKEGGVAPLLKSTI